MPPSPRARAARHGRRVPRARASWIRRRPRSGAGAARLGYPLDAVRTGTAYVFQGRTDEVLLRRDRRRAPEQPGDRGGPGRRPRPSLHPAEPAPRTASRREVPLRDADDARLAAISRKGGLSLSLARDARRCGTTSASSSASRRTWKSRRSPRLGPSIASTRPWPAPIRFQGTVDRQPACKPRSSTPRSELARPFCLSVFHDNAGVVRFDDEDARLHQGRDAQPPERDRALRRRGHRRRRRDPRRARVRARRAARREHRRVLRRAARPRRRAACRKGALHPLRILRGVVAGVRDYGNQMGIPTVNGAIVFDERYVGNPLVFCGTVGLLPPLGRHEGGHARRPHRRRSAGARAATASTARRSRRPSCTRSPRRSTRARCRSATRSPRRRSPTSDPAGARPRPLPRDHGLRRRRLLVGDRRDGRDLRRARRRSNPRPRECRHRPRPCTCVNRRTR